MITIDQQIDQEIWSKRNSLKNVYRTEEGRYQLALMVSEWRIFDVIDPADVEGLALRNYGIQFLERMGLLDGESLLPLLDFMLTHEWKQPVYETGKEI